MDRAYRGRPCSGGGRDSLRPADPDVAAGDGHLHHGTRPGARHRCAISGYKGWEVTICGSQPRNHAPGSADMVGDSSVSAAIQPRPELDDLRV
jgi:hypothetical protein